VDRPRFPSRSNDITARTPRHSKNCWYRQGRLARSKIAQPYTCICFGAGTVHPEISNAPKVQKCQWNCFGTQCAFKRFGEQLKGGAMALREWLSISTVLVGSLVRFFGGVGLVVTLVQAIVSNKRLSQARLLRNHPLSLWRQG
jgi:hypothetical protein